LVLRYTSHCQQTPCIGRGSSPRNSTTGNLFQCIFPNTIAQPADREGYRRRLQVVKDYGFNYARHHSWVPPEEYLDVADELGVMVQPEFPIAYRWDLATTPEGKRFCLDLMFS